jgi:hypothetical protein
MNRCPVPEMQDMRATPHLLLQIAISLRPEAVQAPEAMW